MTKSERQLWQRYFETLSQKKQLEEFLQTLKKPKETKKDALKAYNDLVAGVYSKIFSLLSAARLMKKSVAEIQNRLDSPDCKKNIQLVTHQFLQDNLYAKKCYGARVITLHAPSTLFKLKFLPKPLETSKKIFSRPAKCTMLFAVIISG